MTSLLKCFELEQGRLVRIEALPQRLTKHQSVQIFQWQRTQQERIDRAKHGSVCADAQGERCDGDGGVNWRLQQHPRAVADILPRLPKHKMRMRFTRPCGP